MRYTVVNNVQVNSSGDNISDEELLIYLGVVHAKHKKRLSRLIFS